MAESPTIAVEKMALIAAELRGSFDEERGCYLLGESDRSVGDTVGVPWGWVAKVREVLGMDIRVESKVAEVQDAIEAIERASRLSDQSRGDFVKVSVMLSPDVFDLLSHEAMRRKLAHERGVTRSAVINEAVMLGLKLIGDVRTLRSRVDDLTSVAGS